MLTSAGYGVHARFIARYLFELHDAGEIELFIRAVPWGVTPWLISPELENGLIGRLMERTIEFGGPFDVSIQLQLPNEWDHKLASINIGVTAGVETDICNPAWVGACNEMTGVIVPSDHARSTLQRSGKLTAPIEIVPEPFPDELLSVSMSTLDFPAKKCLLIVGQICGDQNTDRKNVLNTVRAACEALRDVPDSGIVLKTNAGRNTRIDLYQVRASLKALLDQCRPGKQPPVRLMHGTMSSTEIASLYKHPSALALVSLTRGEGFGLPLLEAAACDLPVIATDWSAHCEFLDLGNWIRVKHSLKTIPKHRVDANIFVEGARWAEPDAEDAKKKMKKIFSSPALPKQWAQELGSKIRERYSYDACRRDLDAVLRKHLGS